MSLKFAQELMDIFAEHKIVCMLAGGCVRDQLLGRQPKDFDLAVAANPQTVQKVLEPHVKVLPTGVQYGTWTALRINNGTEEKVEVTSLRRDIKPDGRRAEVTYDDVTFEEDALRRDFTINALFQNRSGEIVDYIQGMADIQARKLKFVGNPVHRIVEDHLRILRFFRFWATLDVSVDPAHLESVLKNKKLVKKLSFERVFNECQKMFLGKTEVVQKFLDEKILESCFRLEQPENIDIKDIPVPLRFRYVLFLCHRKKPFMTHTTAKNFSREFRAYIQGMGIIEEKKSYQNWFDLWSSLEILRKFIPQDPMHEIVECCIVLKKLKPKLLPLIEIFNEFQDSELPFDGHSIMKECGLKEGAEVGKIFLDRKKSYIENLIAEKLGAF